MRKKIIIKEKEISQVLRARRQERIKGQKDALNGCQLRETNLNN